MQAVGSVCIDGLKIFFFKLRVVGEDLIFRSARSKPPEDFFYRNSVAAYARLPTAFSGLDCDSWMRRNCCHRTYALFSISFLPI